MIQSDSVYQIKTCNYFFTGQTNLSQDKLYITELTVFPKFAIVLMKCAFWVTRKLGQKQ